MIFFSRSDFVSVLPSLSSAHSQLCVLSSVDVKKRDDDEKTASVVFCALLKDWLV